MTTRFVYCPQHARRWARVSSAAARKGSPGQSRAAWPKAPVMSSPRVSAAASTAPPPTGSPVNQSNVSCTPPPLPVCNKPCGLPLRPGLLRQNRQNRFIEPIGDQSDYGLLHTFTRRRRSQPRRATVRVGRLAQGHLDTQRGAAGDRTSDLPVTSQPAQSSEPSRLPFINAGSLPSECGDGWFNLCTLNPQRATAVQPHPAPESDRCASGQERLPNPALLHTHRTQHL